MKHKKICKKCGDEFYTYNNEQQYCSYDCYKLHPKKCLYCKQEYKPTTRNQKYCSRKCSGLSQRVNKKNIKCLNCNKSFNVYKKSNAKYCCRKCKDEYQKILFNGKNNPNYGKKHTGMFSHNDSVKQNIRSKIINSWKRKDRRKKHKLFMEQYKRENGFYPMQSPISNENRINSMIKFHEENEHFTTWRGCVRGYYMSTKTNKSEYYHSSYELIRMKQLDDDDTVINWTKRHKIIISYNDGNNFYKPDFFIEYKDKKVIEEVKGWVRNINIFRKKKFAAIKFSKEHGYEYVVNFMGNKRNFVE